MKKLKKDLQKRFLRGGSIPLSFYNVIEPTEETISRVIEIKKTMWWHFKVKGNKVYLTTSRYFGQCFEIKYVGKIQPHTFEDNIVYGISKTNMEARLGVQFVNFEEVAYNVIKTTLTKREERELVEQIKPQVDKLYQQSNIYNKLNTTYQRNKLKSKLSKIAKEYNTYQDYTDELLSHKVDLFVKTDYRY